MGLGLEDRKSVALLQGTSNMVCFQYKIQRQPLTLADFYTRDSVSG